MTEDVKIKPVDASSFDDMLPLLRLLDPARSPASWRALVEAPWRVTESAVGVAAWAGGTPVAFLATIEAAVTVRGTLERVTNLSSWITRPGHGGVGALLAFHALRGRRGTITSFTSNAGASAVLRRLGMQVLDLERRLLLPPLMPKLGRGMPLRVVSTDADLRAVLSTEDRQRYDDHQGVASHAAVVASDGYCYLIWRRGSRRRLGVALIDYISAPERLQAGWGVLWRHLLQDHGIVYGEVDSRMLREARRWFGLARPLAAARLYRSTALQPADINRLYSELPLLGLS